MKDNKSHYSRVTGRGKKTHRIRFTHFAKPIDVLHSTKHEAEDLDTILTRQHETLVELLGDLDLSDLKLRCSHEIDHRKILDAIPDLHYRIEKQIGYIAPIEDDDCLDEETIKIHKRLTLRQATYLYIQAMIDESTPIDSTLMCRFLWWAESAKYRNKQMADISVADLYRERKILENNGGKRGTPLTVGTINHYVSNALGAIYSHTIKRLQLFAIHQPQDMKMLVSKTVVVIPTQPYDLVDANLIRGLGYDYSANVSNKVANPANRRTTYLGHMIDVSLESAIRNKFVGNLRWDEIRGLSGRDPVVIKVMKGTKPSTVPLSKKAAKVLLEMKAIMPSEEWVFPSVDDNSKPTTTEAYTKMVKKIIKVHNNKGGHQIMVSKKAVHSFRATAATRMADKGYGPHLIAELLQCSLSVAKGYVKQSSAARDHVRAAMDGMDSGEPTPVKRDRHLKAVS